ncbi:MAG TPA: PASTA domain-containing protein [Mycobacteriales bacterium]|jgi:transposase-like protein
MGLWDDGRRAWERLDGWGEDTHPDSGSAALAALSDIGTVRRLLDQAELSVVRTARRHGKSWAEIATRLGVTRQSAWERWRDLDEEQQEDVVGAAARELTARQRRRLSSVVVPSVIGLSFDKAVDLLTAVGLVAMSENVSGVVSDQTPEAGARVPAGSMVRLWVERDGGSGVREPRRPKPNPRSGRALPPELSDDAVS